MPKRIQRQRTKGWRMPEGAVYVGRPTKFGNPFVVGADYMPWLALAAGYQADRKGRTLAAVEAYRAWLTETPMRPGPILLYPAEGIGSFEYETGAVATIDQVCVGIARVSLAKLYTPPQLPAERPELTELRGKDLVCWCPLEDADGNPVPCHADVLLEWANRGVGA